MSQLPATILLMLTFFVTRDLRPVYAAHIRKAPLGAEHRAEVLAEQQLVAAEREGVDVALLAAVTFGESAFDHTRISPKGARGGMQLLPSSPWGRAWAAACPPDKEATPACEALNVLWGARALRAAIDACGGDEHQAVGMYRSGHCVAGPRGARTLELAAWLRARLGGARALALCGLRADLDPQLQPDGIELGLERELHHLRLVVAQPLGPRGRALNAHRAGAALDVAEVRLGHLQQRGELGQRLLLALANRPQEAAQRERTARAREVSRGLLGSSRLLLRGRHDLHLSRAQGPFARAQGPRRSGPGPRCSVSVLVDLAHFGELHRALHHHVDGAVGAAEADGALPLTLPLEGLVMVAADLPHFLEAVDSHRAGPSLELGGNVLRHVRQVLLRRLGDDYDLDHVLEYPGQGFTVKTNKPPSGVRMSRAA